VTHTAGTGAIVDRCRISGMTEPQSASSVFRRA